MPHSILLDQAAQMLGVSRRTVYYRIRDGRLRTLRTRCGSQRVLMESIVEMMRADRGLPPVAADVVDSNPETSANSPSP